MLLYNELRPPKLKPPFERGSKRAKSCNERFNVGNVVMALLPTVVAGPDLPEFMTAPLAPII